MHNDKKAYQVDRTPTELLSDLLVQLKFLRQECLHYDAGDWSYGAQIATKLRLLLHQTKYSDSLLAQITKRFAISWPVKSELVFHVKHPQAGICNRL